MLAMEVVVLVTSPSVVVVAAVVVEDDGARGLTVGAAAEVEVEGESMTVEWSSVEAGLKARVLSSLMADWTEPLELMVAPCWTTPMRWKGVAVVGVVPRQ